MSDEREEQRRSALEDLRPFAWSNEQSINYEVAPELIGQVVAEYNGLIHREQAKDFPDAEALVAGTVVKREHIARRRSLQVLDTEGIAYLRDECVGVLGELRGEH